MTDSVVYFIYLVHFFYFILSIFETKRLKFHLFPLNWSRLMLIYTLHSVLSQHVVRCFDRVTDTNAHTSSVCAVVLMRNVILVEFYVYNVTI